LGVVRILGPSEPLVATTDSKLDALQPLAPSRRVGQRQAAEKGRWLNRAPTGYEMINGTLTPNEMAVHALQKELKDYAANRFEHIARLLAELDFAELWERANARERRSLVEDLIDSVRIFPDTLTVQMVGAPLIIVTLDEVGLHGGITPVVSEARRNSSATLHWRLNA
jgi:hypothetical protein